MDFWRVLTVCTDIMDSIFRFFTGILHLLASIAAINERIVQALIGAFWTGLDRILFIISIIQRLFTFRVSVESLCFYADEILWPLIGIVGGFMKRQYIPITCCCGVIVFGVVLVRCRARILTICLEKLLPVRAKRWILRYARRGRILLINANDYDGDSDDDDDGVLLGHDGDQFSEDELGRDADLNQNNRAELDSSRTISRVSRRSSSASSSSQQNNSNSSNKDDSYKLLCVICQDQVKSVLVLPCRHLCLCFVCARVICTTSDLPKKCPLCRTGIRKMINAYM